jgi:pyruvate carboxylase
VKGKPIPAKLKTAPIPRHCRPPPPGTKQLLDQLGPENSPRGRKQKRLLLTDTTLRDAHQSLMATSMRTYDMAAIANFIAHRMRELYSLEMWGGATFDVSMRFLLEDPWERLRRLRERGAEHLLPDAAARLERRRLHGVSGQRRARVRLWRRRAGMDIFRVFDSLNWLPNMKVAMEAVRKTDKSAKRLCATRATFSIRQRDKYSLEYYVRMAKELEKMGAHMLAIKDMAGLCKPVRRARNW